MGLAQRLADWLNGLDRRIRKSYNVPPDTPENRRRARIYNLWLDHEILRILWTNEFQIAPGVYRANQPTERRFHDLKARGIDRVINLRGESNTAHFLWAKVCCEEAGLELIPIGLNARKAPPRERLLELIEVFRTIEPPFVMHCKSGADRSGLAAAIYLMVMEGASTAEARKMFSLKYAHVRWSSTGILDHILTRYEARTAERAISFEDWIESEYDADDLQRSFDALPIWRR